MDQVINLSKKFWKGLEAADVDYGLLLDGKPTTHHFATTEVFHKQDGEWKLIQFTFTALVY